MKSNKMYIYDCLYGPIYLDNFVMEVMTCSELQRLREIRLCNINSLSLTGGANVNRYEHSIGTAYLAQQCIDSWSEHTLINSDERKTFILAALLHDVANGPFGHSLEYIESKDGFNPEVDFEYAITGKKGSTYNYRTLKHESIFFGSQRELASIIRDENELSSIGKIINGQGKYGPLISNDIDLDNIDNVFRMAYHIGLVKCGDVPLKLAKSLFIMDGHAVIKKDAIPYLEEWYKVRKTLYEYLLLNPEEFSAKCMLTEAISLAKISDKASFRWFDIDYELLRKLSVSPNVKITLNEPLITIDLSFKESLKISKISTELQDIFKEKKINISSSSKVEIEDTVFIIKENSVEYIIEEINGSLLISKKVFKEFNITQIVNRLMTGDLYGCIGIYSTYKIENYTLFNDIKKKIEVENNLSNAIRQSGKRVDNIMIALHPILDKNKTKRKINILTNEGNTLQVGESSRHLLIGVFIKNTDFNAYKISSLKQDILINIRDITKSFLSDLTQDDCIKELELYGEKKI